MTLTQLRDAVRIRLGVPVSDAFYTSAVLTDLVNEGLQAYSTEVDWPWLGTSTTFSTVAGTQAYTPPANWNRTKLLTPDESDTLVLMSLAEVREYGKEEHDRAFPTVYTIWGEQILLAPVPAGIYTIKHDYIKAEPELDQDNDTPLLPSQYHYALVHFAAAAGQLRQNETQRWEAEMKNYETWIKRMLKNDRRSTQTMRVRVRPGSHLF